MRREDICLAKVFEKFLRAMLFLANFWTFSFQAFTFQVILLGILIPNSQTRHFPGSVTQKTLKFQKGIILVGGHFMLI